MSEFGRFRTEPLSKVERRFAIYKQLGFGLLRTGIGWWGLERAEGQWNEPAALTRYFAAAIRNGFRLKLGAVALNAPPAWFLEAHPDAQIRDASGAYSKSSLSLWYPGLRPLLAEKTDKVVAYLAQMGALAAADYLFVDLGYANQPTYPLRSIGNCRGATPWFYDANARNAFGRAMRDKYSTLAATNRAWGTNFATWSEVRPPQPGEHPGSLWNDALAWYRDSKRAVDSWQVENYRRAVERHTSAGHRPTLIVMVAGAHIRPGEWDEAVRLGIPDCSLVIMSDSEFPLKLARDASCWLQYTGAENGSEAHYLKAVMHANNINIPMWAENAGRKDVAMNPRHLVDVIMEEGLYGLDYVNSRYLFESDGTTPNENSSLLEEACSRLLARI